MEAFLVLLAGLYGLGLPIGVIYLLIQGGNQKRDLEGMKRRLSDAESRLSSGERISTFSGPDAVADAPQRHDAEAAGAGPKETKTPNARALASASNPWQSSPSSKSTTSTPTKTPPAKTSSAPTPRAVKTDLPFDKFVAWIVQNWVYAVAAVSLALAGIFMVQYGIENGLLPPFARVLASLAFGAALVGGGEYMRKRWGDDENSPVAFLPSVFSGAGIVTLFAGILAARHMYGLIGPTTTFAGLLCVAGGAIVLGWLTGPLLAAVGIVGAFVTPFLLGGNSDASPVVGYLAIVTLVGLAIDTYRQWKWLSVLSLGLGYVLIAPLVVVADARVEWVIAFALLMPFAALIVMGWRLVPALPGRGLMECIAHRVDPKNWPRRMMLLHAAMAGSVLWLLASSQAGAAEFWLSAFAMTALAAGMAIWAKSSNAMEDLPLLPSLGLIALIWIEAANYGSVYRLSDVAAIEGNGNTQFWTPVWLVAMGALLGVIATWRSLTSAKHPRVWALAAALIAPAAMISLDISWRPSSFMGDFEWAVVAIALAALMVVKVERFARAQDADRMRLSLVLISALGLISYAMALVLPSSGLTVALALTVLASVVIDRRFDLPLLSWFTVVGTILVSGTLLFILGLTWHEYGPLLEVIATYGVTLGALAAAWVLGQDRNRKNALITIESAVVSLFAVFVMMMLRRWLDTLNVSGDTHWNVTLIAMVWLLSASVQAWRMKLPGFMRKVRMALGGMFALGGVGTLLVALVLGFPFEHYNAQILGWPLVNTLAIAYLLPAALFVAVAWKMPHLPAKLRLGLGAAAAGLSLLWGITSIAHFWRGAYLAQEPMLQPELYTYTVAMLALGAALLYQAIARRSDLLRRVAMGAIALTVAKVFLVDISGLDGLMRVFSFLALGLSLAGLAWLNRWAAMQSQTGASDQGKTP